MADDRPTSAATGFDAYLGLWLAAWVRGIVRAPVLVLLGALLTTGLVGYYTANHLGVDTNPADLFDDELSFRKSLADFESAFPQFQDLLVVVIDGDDATAVDRSAGELTERLRGEPERFKTVYSARGDPFFARHGLLYLSIEELRELAAPLTQMAPLLKYLEASPSLERLATALGRAFALAGAQAPGPLMAIARGTTTAIAAAREGEVATFDWRGVLGGSAASGVPRQILVVQPSRDYTAFLPSGPAVERTRELIAELGFAESGVRARLTGDVALAHDELEEASRGAAMAGMLALVLVAVFLSLGLRSPRLVIASLLTLIVGLVWTAGWAALAVGHLNLISVAFAVLYISLGVDFSIHLCLRLRELRSLGHDIKGGLELAARDVGGSLVLAAVTTALGFAAFVPTQFTGVAELGIIAGGGMLISLLANLTVLPALLCWAPLRPRTPAAKIATVGAPAAALLAPLRNHATQARRAALAVAAVAICLVPWARFDANPLNLRNPDAESVRAFRDLALNPNTTPFLISVLTADAEQSAQLARALDALETVASAVRVEDLVPSDQDTKLDTLDRARSALGTPPASPEPAPTTDPVPALRQLRDALDRLPPGAPAAAAALQDQVDGLVADLDTAAPDGRAALVERVEVGALDGLPPAVVRLRDSLQTDGFALSDLPPAHLERWIAPDGRRRVEARPREDMADTAALERFAESVLTVAPTAIGGPVIVTESARVAVESFRFAFAYALAAMTVTLLLILRSARDVVLILIPLALAGLLTIATTAVLGLAFNFANVIALPLLLGMSVDNGIHMVHRFRADPAAAHRLLDTSTARAVLFSSLTTLGGFGTLVVSPHPGTASLGLLLCIGIVANLLCTLVLLPILLVQRGK